MSEEREGAERIVVIDDDYAMRLSCRQILSKTGFDVEVYEDGAQGLVGVASQKPALVVVDLKMPGLSGLDVIRRVHEIDPEIVVVVITGYATIGTAVEAMKCGAYDFLPKPFKPDELRMIVSRGLERRRLLLRSRELEMERELMKRRFMSFMTHQLKSPLAAIHQYLEVLKRLGDTPEMEEKRAEWIDRCLSRTTDLRRLIDDWLTLAKAEGGGLVGRRERVDAKKVVAGLLAAYEEVARSARVTLSSEMPADEYPVVGDRNCLVVLLENLITNGIDYNRPGGSVTVGAHQEPGEVVVEVRDTGVGIPAEAQGLLFEEFFRVPAGDESAGASTEDGRGRKKQGTGLGLPICRRIVNELGGGIEVESEVGVGTTFRVRLPAYRPAPQPGELEVSTG